MHSAVSTSVGYECERKYSWAMNVTVYTVGHECDRIYTLRATQLA